MSSSTQTVTLNNNTSDANSDNQTTVIVGLLITVIASISLILFTFSWIHRRKIQRVDEEAYAESKKPRLDTKMSPSHRGINYNDRSLSPASIFAQATPARDLLSPVTSPKSVLPTPPIQYVRSEMSPGIKYPKATVEKQ
ncbi:hypothetical protein HK096_010678 [Nowakowskiella sp. JEL0078]|nr:hypothetical protein HK096_010678 [Nowakowskiella sp. JEL0078]